MRTVAVCLNPSVDQFINVATLQLGQLNRVSSVRNNVGGKAINVAKTLHHFGMDICVVGFVAGRNGSYIEEKLARLGVECSFLHLAGETRTNLKLYDTASESITEINGAGHEVNPADLERFQQRLINTLQLGDTLVLSGSLPPGAPTDIYGKLISIAHQKNVITVLDADGPALRFGVQAGPSYMKPNLPELQELTGGKVESVSDMVEACREMISGTGNGVMLSLGSAGALWVDAENAWSAYAPQVKVDSTVGCGDSMVASLIYGVSQGWDSQEILRFAVASGTVTATKPGSGVCQLKEVVTLLPEIRLDVLR